MKVRIFDISTTETVKQFLTSQGLAYTRGCLYYQLTKKELIQDAKSVIVRKKEGGHLLKGEQIREVLGIPGETASFQLNLTELPDFDVFIQSTSPVRKLLAGTKALYDVGEGDGQTVLETSEMVTEDPVAPEVTRVTETKPLEVVISFDTTGSMYPCLTQVRTNVRQLIQSLFSSIPDIRMGIIAHGDYGDHYVTKHTNLLRNQEELCRFVETVESTNGFDCEECYELVLREAHTKVNWSPDSKKILIMIGDAEPHPPLCPRNQGKIDWRKEATELLRRGITIYAVQALGRSWSRDSFWKPLAQETGGIHLQLDQFSHAKDYIQAICLHSQSTDSLQEFRTQIVEAGRMNRSLHGMFATLLRDTTAFGENEEGLERVPPSRFQVLEVGTEKISIKQFAQDNGLTFKVGRGFYEFTKPEVISDKKEIVLMSKRTGDMFTGEEAARLIGVGGEGRIKPADLDKWRVFVQSTSANRVLVPRTGFLYEVDTSS